MRRVRGMAVDVEAWRYADGSEAKAMALCYTTVGPKVRLSGVCQVVKVVLVAPKSQGQPLVARESLERKEPPCRIKGRAGSGGRGIGGV